LCDLTIAIPTRDKHAILDGTLRAVSRLGSSCPVVVVDSSARVPDGFWDEWSSRLPGLRVIRVPEGAERARARNICWRAVETEFVWFLDDDVRPVPEALEAHRAVLSQPKTISQGRVPPDPENPISAAVCYLDGINSSIDRRMYSFGNGASLDPYLLLTGNVAIPTTVLRKLGGLDEDFVGWGFEDLDLGVRLVEGGCTIRLACNAVGYHHYKETIEGLLKKRREAGRTASQLFVLHPGLRKRPLFDDLWRDVQSARGLRLQGIGSVRHVVRQLLAFAPVQLAIRIVHDTLRAFGIGCAAAQMLNALWWGAFARGVKEAQCTYDA
jgi:cellulose synthase/poly-beta-1,6-N-acetylglucosamine synthase-like glycosyltransferase